MKKPCKECPHLIRNRHNDMIVEFGKRTGKKHNCHMTEGKKDLWNVTDDKLECYGRYVMEYQKNKNTIIYCTEEQFRTGYQNCT